jgi:signal transduction histidine kinase
MAWAVPVCLVVPVVAARAAEQRIDTIATAGLVETVLNAMVLAVALALYVRWRITRVPSIAWVTAALAAVALEHLTPRLMSALAHVQVEHRPVWTLLVDIVFTGSLATLVVVRRHRAPRLDPALVGVGLGLAVGTVRLSLILVEPLAAPTAALLATTALLTVVLHCALLLVLLHLGLPAPLPRAGALLAVLLTTGAMVAVPVHAWHGSGPAGTWAGAGTALLVAGTAIALLHASIVDSTRTVAGLRRRVDEVEAGVAADRERLHEINATVAGIATASRLMHDHHDLPRDHRERLDELLTAEIQRLERLVEGRATPLGEVAVDATVERLVLAHRGMGRDVRWSPCGLVVTAHDDDLVEVLTTLLNNAAEHAPGSPVELSARRLEGAVQITVSDHGPGVGEERAEQIFQRGARGRASHGQGIGLYVARRITEHLGGSLFVVPAQAGSRRGAIFVLTLPTTGSPRGAVSASAT